jgi:tetratricopeptide (TPR) repeat protein
MGAKEVMATAPIVVFLYDRTFVAGTFGRAWHERRRYYLGLAGTWLLLALLVLGARNRGGTVAYGIGVSPWAYALTQAGALVHYLRLSVWPRPLVFDYGAEWVARPWTVLPDAAIVAALAAACAIALFRTGRTGAPPSPAGPGPGARALGFAGAWFFLILAPTSSLVPGNRQTIAEHRMYLPLAAVVAVVVWGLDLALRRVRGALGIRRDRGWEGAVFAGLAALCLILTVERNGDYRSAAVLYGDTVAKRPGNVLARYNLGLALAAEGRHGEAANAFEAAVRLEPGFPQALANLADQLCALGRVGEGAARYGEALRIDPNYAGAHCGLGKALLRLGRPEEARWHFNAAVLLDPSRAEAVERLRASPGRRRRPRRRRPGQKGAPPALVPHRDTWRPSREARAAFA